jgi:two-component system OmpR family sensor kinase
MKVKGLRQPISGAIFERFVRLHRRGDGAGLGLAIARTIIEAHGGEITVDSVLHKGSLFSLWLPLGKTS